MADINEIFPDYQPDHVAAFAACVTGRWRGSSLMHRKAWAMIGCYVAASLYAEMN